MSTTVQKSESKDFPNGLSESQLHEDIENSQAITTVLINIQHGNDVDDDPVYINFQTVPTVAELTALDGLIASHLDKDPVSALMYDAVVDTHGNGDFKTIAEALDDGRRSLFVRNGTYVETKTLVIPNYGQIKGESGGNVVIAGAGISVDGNGGVKITDGTIGCTKGSAVVTGTDTKFLSATPGMFIRIGTNFFAVVSIQSDTSLTLAFPYNGRTRSGMSCLIQSMVTGVKLENLVVTGSTGNGILFRGARHSSMHSISTLANAANIVVQDCGDCSFIQILSGLSATPGVVIDGCFSTVMNTADLYNNTSHGVHVRGNCLNVVFEMCEMSNNGGNGILFEDNADDCDMESCIIRLNDGHGIESKSSVMRLSVQGATVADSKGSGFVAGSECTLVASCFFLSNDGDGLVLSASAIVDGTHCIGNGGDGIVLETGANRCSIESNVVRDNVNGIVVKSNDVILSGNQVFGQSAKGIDIVAGATDTICIANNAKGNTGANYTNAGTSTEAIGNKT